MFRFALTDMVRSITVIIPISIVMSGGDTARAHQTWADGKSLPAWVVRSCCGPAEAHHLSPDQVHRVLNGYTIDGLDGIVEDYRVLPSEDGEFWAFYIEGTEKGHRLNSSVFCFFAPFGS